MNNKTIKKKKRKGAFLVLLPQVYPVAYKEWTAPE
jgi:hypothetical protein